MLNSDVFDLLWSTFIDEQVCTNLYTDCTNNCGYDGECSFKSENPLYEYDFDVMNNIIKEDFNMRFGENDYMYFVKGDSCLWCCDYLKPNMNGFSDIYSSVKDILNVLKGEDYRIYKGKYNSVWIESCSHDGSMIFQLMRLNNQGLKYYDMNYDFDFTKHCVKGVLKDFDFYK